MSSNQITAACTYTRNESGTTHVIELKGLDRIPASWKSEIMDHIRRELQKVPIPPTTYIPNFNLSISLVDDPNAKVPVGDFYSVNQRLVAIEEEVAKINSRLTPSMLLNEEGGSKKTTTEELTTAIRDYEKHKNAQADAKKKDLGNRLLIACIKRRDEDVLAAFKTMWNPFGDLVKTSMNLIRDVTNEGIAESCRDYLTDMDEQYDQDMEAQDLYDKEAMVDEVKD
jgi:hypothetical protein